MDYMRKVLVLEDDINFYRLLLDTIGLRAEITYARNLSAAMNEYQSDKFTLFILDYCLQKGTKNSDGIMYTKYIRANDEETPILMCSSSKGVEGLARNKGVSFFIQKDDVSGLKKVLERVLG